MQKVTREAEYFKNITHDEIDKQMQYLDQAMKNKKNINKAGEAGHQDLKIEELQKINSIDDIYIQAEDDSFDEAL